MRKRVTIFHCFSIYKWMSQLSASTFMLVSGMHSVHHHMLSSIFATFNLQSNYITQFSFFLTHRFLFGQYFELSSSSSVYSKYALREIGVFAIIYCTVHTSLCCVKVSLAFNGDQWFSIQYCRSSFHKKLIAPNLLLGLYSFAIQ